MHVVRRGPRAVVGIDLAGIQQRSATELGRAHGEKPLITKAAVGLLENPLLDAVAQIDGERAGIGEVAGVGEVWAFADIQTADGFRHQPVQIGVTLAVGMGRQIDRHVVDEDRQVGAVIEVVAAQIILIGLAAVGMLDHRQAGRRFENFAGPRRRTIVQILPGHRHLARHGGRDRRAAGDIGRTGLVRRRYRRWGHARRGDRRRLCPCRTRLGMRGGHLDGRERSAAA